MPGARDSAPEVTADSAADLRDWLERHHATSTGVWLVTWKKAAGARHLPWSAVVRECLCFGWIDSLPRAKDDLRTLLWIAPRKPGSHWSAVNKAHVAALRAAGLMQPAGDAAARALADGSWSALDAVDRLELPADLALALDDTPGARAAWDSFPPSVRRGVLETLLNARRPATRAGRIAQITAAAARGERPFQWRKG